MRGLRHSKSLVSVFALLVAFILVHAVYVSVIWPEARAFVAEEQASKAIDENHEPRRSVYVLLRDFEQEACMVLALWAFMILGLRMVRSTQQLQQLKRDFIGTVDDTGITVHEAKSIADRLRERAAMVDAYLLPRVLLSSLDRFCSTTNIEAASNEVINLCEEEGERLESELSIIRYIAWAIPSIGFIGTVRGIGGALAQADKATTGDITGVTTSLGVAFNSTFVALLISIVLMFIIHQVQSAQERLVLNTQRYCHGYVVSRLTT